MSKKYIKKLEIKNLQSHEDTTLDLHPGVNVIMGENGVGKSAIVRAIRQLFYNSPVRNVDELLLRKNKGSFVVKATMGDGSWVMREKGKDVNRYILFDDVTMSESGGILELNSIGTDVPEDVGRILGAAKVQLSKTGTELNISPQDESSFMLSQSNPEIARWIYSLTQLGLIRKSIDDLNKDAKKLKAQTKEADIRIIKSQEKLKELDWINDCEKGLNKSKEILQKIEIENIRLLELQELQSNIEKLKSKAKPIISRINLLEPFMEDFSDEYIKNIDDKISDLSKLVEINNKIIEIDTKINSIDCDIELLNELIPLIPDCQKSIDDILNIITINNNIINADEKINEILKRNKYLSDAIKKCENEMDDIKSKIFSDGDNGVNICPFCKHEVDEDFIEHLIEEFGK